MSSKSLSKRKRLEPRVDAVPKIPNPVTYEAAEAAIRNLIKQFGIDPAQFQDDSSEDGAGVSFSKVAYSAVAHLVGLQAPLSLKDIKTFEIHRSRIPTDLFKSIVMDMDVMLVQYSPFPEHKTEEARSRFFSPVFNHLVKQFTFMLRNDPETIIAGRIGTGGRIEYFFKTFGATAILCIEMKLTIGNDVEHLDAIAQVIAECDGCDLSNTEDGFSLPIHCIHSDGLSFEFFKFERTQGSSFLRGCLTGDPVHLRRGLRVPDFTKTETSLPFIVHLRCVCETIFDTMLCAYISGLKAYHNRSKVKGEKQGSKRPSFDGWDRALRAAENALTRMRGLVVWPVVQLGGENNCLKC